MIDVERTISMLRTAEDDPVQQEAADLIGQMAVYIAGLHDAIYEWSKAINAAEGVLFLDNLFSRELIEDILEEAREREERQEAFDREMARA